MIHRSAFCEIDLAGLRKNLAILRAIAGTRTLLVVKANAYGHGLVPIAKEALAAGVDWLGVATIGEADELRGAGVTARILMMVALDSNEIEYCVAKEIDFLAWRPDHFRVASAASERYGTRPRVHIEIDTGMSRSGVAVREFPALIDSLQLDERQQIVGIASHFYGADLPDLDSATRQLQEFSGCIEIARSIHLDPLVHMANSPALLRLPAGRLSMSRIGIAAYGLAPSESSPLPDGVEPILSWKATVTNMTDLQAGQGVSYGWQYVADRPQTVGTIAVGYADGFRRAPQAVNTVVVAGNEVPVLGRICMDQCVFRLPESGGVAVGDTVVLLGRAGNLELTADTLAERWGTNSYDVVSGIRSRIPRIYLDGIA
jgi:alanine racemase